MCVIAISPKGARQPTKAEFLSMWNKNPHGGGYMSARYGQVEIHKGFMCFSDFYRSVCNEHFTKNDSVVYHFRISTQGGINAEMTHPFPLCSDFDILSALDVSCSVGIAHNGIIRMTSDFNNKYSDTALFIAEYMTRLVRSVDDLHDEKIMDMLSLLTGSKLAIMDKNGEVYTIGDFHNENGILLSNKYHLIPNMYTWTKGEIEKCIV